MRLHTLGAALLPMLAAGLVAVQPLRAATPSESVHSSAALPANAIWLESLDLTKMTAGWGSPNAGMSVGNNPITLDGVVYPHGVGTHANSETTIDLHQTAVKFVSAVGVDDETHGPGSVTFTVVVDGTVRAQTPVLHSKEAPQVLSVDLAGAKQMKLVIGDGGDGNGWDHADWAGAMLFLKPGTTRLPFAVGPPPDPIPVIYSGTSPKPAIHGATVVGATPGNPFLFLVPATGQGPLVYTAKNLPAGLELNEHTGIITGSLRSAGKFVSTLTVTAPRGKASSDLTIVGGKDKLALTPPMGWNSWNVWAGSVDDAKVRAAADWMVKSGLAAHGYQYINIDDTWEGPRDANGEITSNQKFPDMKALADYVHSKGLKLGIYSSPGPTTCAGYPASYGHEQQDADTYAKWGIDYLKYDWCSYGNVAGGNTLADLQKPYKVMHRALDKCGRDIVFSLCQYGMGDVWKWGAQVGGNCWRTTGDIGDSWDSMSGIGFGQAGHEKYAGPGHWNDPDMMVVGKLGWGPSLHETHLTPNEQLTHVTLWTLLSAPMLLGCDLSQLDPWTIHLLTNDEVIAVHNDPLGKQASRRSQNGALEVWARPLVDGTLAVGLFNRGDAPATVTAKWADLGISGPQPVRDLWRHENLGEHNNAFSAKVRRHGVVFVKIGKPGKLKMPAY